MKNKRKIVSLIENIHKKNVVEAEKLVNQIMAEKVQEKINKIKKDICLTIGG